MTSFKKKEGKFNNKP